MNDNPGLYIHIPFCLSRCIYCTFSSQVYQPGAADRYLDSLYEEMARKAICARQFVPSSLFIGGGTPSCLSLPQLKRLLSFVPFPDSNGEATVELNPDSCGEAVLDALLEKGVNRCSFGVQTFDAAGLAFMRRRHDAKTANKAVSMAKQKGAHSVNIDLIAAWPGQTIAVLRDDIARAADLGVTHISCYSMMIEAEGAFRRSLDEIGMREKDDDEERKFWDTTNELLARSGFVRYEVSNFARPGFECRHNLSIWKGGAYQGVGASAHSYIDGRRFANFDSVDQYIEAIRANASTEQFSECLGKEARARECAVFWLRLTEGVALDDFQKTTGMDFLNLYATELPPLLDAGMLVVSRGEDGKKYVRVPEDYFPVLDSILIELV